MAVANKPGRQPAIFPPNQTLYISNLPDWLPKHDLRMALYCLCSTYGTVVDIVALKTMKMRGQAHIAFRDVQASTQAMRALQGFDFFGKEMRVAYAKGKTNSVAMLDGTYKMPVPIQTSTATAQTTLQQAVFGGAPSGLSDKTEPAKSLAVSKANGTDTAHSPQGTKRPREEDEEDEDVPMDEEDQQSDVSMEEGSSSESEND